MNLLKKLASVSSMTLLSRIFGFIRDAVLARVFGAGLLTDAFFVAFTIPNLLRQLFAEGALSQAFVPVLAEYKNLRGREATLKLISHTATLLALALAIIVAIGVIAAPLLIYVYAPGYVSDPEKFGITVDMLRIVFPYIFFVSLVALAGGVLNSHGRFMVPAFTPILLNISFLTFALVLAGWFEPPVLALAWAVFVGGIIKFLFQVPFLKSLGMVPRLSLDLKDEGVSRILKLMGPAILGISMSQIAVLVNTAFASFLETGSVSWLYYAFRLESFPVALLGSALGAIILPSLSKYHAVKSPDDYSKLLDWGLRLAVLLALPAMLALALLSTPLIATLFYYGEFSARDVAMVRDALIAVSFGVPGIVFVRVLAPGFYARQDVKTPFRVAGICILITMLMNAVLIGPLKHAGLALAVSIGSTLNAAMLFNLLRKRGVYHPHPGWRGFGSKIAIALTLMGLTIYFGAGSEAAWLTASASDRIVHLFLLIVIAAGVYFGALWLMGFRPRDFSKRVAA